MIDDLISVTNVNQTPSMNHKINTFIESKKLQLTKTKCYQIIGKGHWECLTWKVHENDMNTLDSEKYIGDIIDKTGSIQETITIQKSKGKSIITERLEIFN